MGFPDGATMEQQKLASAGGVTRSVAYTRSGADLEFARLTRQAAGQANASGADLQQQWNRANAMCTGESTYLAAGGKVTRLIGQGFIGATGAQAGGTAFTAFSVLDDERIQATTPAKGAGTYDLTILHPDGNMVLVGGIVYV